MFLPSGYFTIGQAATKLLRAFESRKAETEYLGCPGNGDNEQTARYEIGAALASNQLRCVGVLPDGRIASIPDEFWRTQDCKPVISEDSPISLIFLPTLRGKWTGVQPLIAEPDFQRRFACEGSFSAPSVWPPEWGQSPFIVAGANGVDDPTQVQGAPASPEQSRSDPQKMDDLIWTSEIVPPERASMDAAELMSWVAFRKRVPLERWATEVYHLARKWPVQTATFYDPVCGEDYYSKIDRGPSFLLAVLESELKGVCWTEVPELCIPDPYGEKASAVSALLDEAPCATLVQSLRTDIARSQRINLKLRAAAADIRRALSTGSLRSVAACHPIRERSPIEAPEWKIGVDLFPDSTMRETGVGEKRDSLLFDALEVLEIWPESGRAKVATITGLSPGVHAIPEGYIAFDQISRVAQIWAKKGNIDAELLDLLDPIDTDVMTKALATGSLRAFGINKRTGAIVSLPPEVWRIDVGGAPQTIWATGGHDVVAGAGGDPCLPIIARADFARALNAKNIPPDPEELPESCKATASEKPSPSRKIAENALQWWMRGLALGYKQFGKILKRDEAIQAATAQFHCTTRQAEAAFSALPYPELRNPPRKSAV